MPSPSPSQIAVRRRQALLDMKLERHASTIQGAWRRKRSRDLLTELAMTVYTKHMDPGTGYTYYVHLKSGALAVHAPFPCGDPLTLYCPHGGPADPLLLSPRTPCRRVAVGEAVRAGRQGRAADHVGSRPCARAPATGRGCPQCDTARAVLAAGRAAGLES